MEIKRGRARGRRRKGRRRGLDDGLVIRVVFLRVTVAVEPVEEVDGVPRVGRPGGLVENLGVAHRRRSGSGGARGDVSAGTRARVPDGARPDGLVGDLGRRGGSQGSASDGAGADRGDRDATHHDARADDDRAVPSALDGLATQQRLRLGGLIVRHVESRKSEGSRGCCRTRHVEPSGERRGRSEARPFFVPGRGRSRAENPVRGTRRDVVWHPGAPPTTPLLFSMFLPTFSFSPRWSVGHPQTVSTSGRTNRRKKTLRDMRSFTDLDLF